MTSPQHGLKAIFLKLVDEDPGLTSKEYTLLAIERGLWMGNGNDPVQSGYTTIDKEYREGRLPEVMKSPGRNGRYYPAGFRPESGTQFPSLRLDVNLPAHTAEYINNLLEIGKFKSGVEAVLWLVEEGVTAKQAALDRIANEVKEIRMRKENAQRLL